MSDREKRTKIYLSIFTIYIDIFVRCWRSGIKNPSFFFELLTERVAALEARADAADLDSTGVRGEGYALRGTTSSTAWKKVIFVNLRKKSIASNVLKFRRYLCA